MVLRRIAVHGARFLHRGTWPLGVLLTTPLMASAEKALKDIAVIFVNLFNGVIGLMMVLSLLGFIWGVIQFIYAADDDRSRATGKRLMVWGTIALFLMVAVWGVVRIIKLTFLGNA